MRAIVTGGASGIGAAVAALANLPRRDAADAHPSSSQSTAPSGPVAPALLNAVARERDLLAAAAAALVLNPSVAVLAPTIWVASVIL